MLEVDTVSGWNENGSNGYPSVNKERCAENGGEYLSGEILVNLESYFDDITDRLTVSRMVSNSVIKGMVNAVEQEAAQKIAAKELEIANLKESLQFCNVDIGKIDCLGSCMDKIVPEGKNCSEHWTFDETFLKHDMMMDSLKALRDVADQQLRKLKNGLHGARSSSIRRINSGSELVGLGGILLEKEDSPGFAHVDRILDGLKVTLDSICLNANSLLMLSKSVLCDWSQERDLKSQIEAMVMQSLIQSIQQEFEQKLWDQSSWLSSSQNFDWMEKLNHISSLHKDLDAIMKSLPSGEAQLAAYGSHDADHFHRKVLSNHVTSSTTHQEGNGNLESPDSDEPESYDAAQLKHLSKEELVGYFNNIITKMRRNHESTVQKLTEELFSLKREYLKERGSSLPHKKDKEFDILRKKIPDIILKLDNILMQKEKLTVVSKDADNFGGLKGSLDNLLSENHHLRDSLREKKSELKRMSFQLSDAAEKVLQHSSAEIKMLKLIGKLQSDLEDAHIGATLQKDVQKCVLAELIGDIKFYTEELDLAILLKQKIYEVIFSGATANVETEQNCKIECFDMESLITQELNEMIFKETLEEIKELHLIEKQKCAYFEAKAVEKENELKVVAEQNERLKEKISVVAKLLDEKEKEATEVSAALAKEREIHELASRELDSLREERNQQRILASESSNLVDSLNGQLLRALEQIELDKIEILKLNQKLEESLKDLNDANEQRKIVVAESAQLFEAKERELKMQRELVIFNVQGLLKMLTDFEFKVSGQIKENKLRIEDSFSELSSLFKKAKFLKRTGLMYKQKFERTFSDLHKAEAEVDLLGDEVDTLLNLLEKIYIALDHYSPVLQHYPGIIETLTLIRRELSGVSRKSV